MKGFCEDCEDFRGGGLGGGAARLFPPLLSFVGFMTLPLTVELDDEDVRDSRTAAKPWGSTLMESTSFDMLPVLRPVTAGRVKAALCCRNLFIGNALLGAIRPGDCDDIEVGVVSRLYGPGPGDAENLVEGLPLMALTCLLLAEKSKLPGVGGGRS